MMAASSSHYHHHHRNRNENFIPLQDIVISKNTTDGARGGTDGPADDDGVIYLKHETRQ